MSGRAGKDLHRQVIARSIGAAITDVLVDGFASPAELAVAEADGLARALRAPSVLSAGEGAGRLARLSWAVFECARTPYVLLVTIFLFGPYFAKFVVVHNAVRGQEIWLDIQGLSGLVIAAFAPFIGAIADAGGRRKPWIAMFVLVMMAGSALLWYAKPHSSGLSIAEVSGLVIVSYVAFEFMGIFYNSMLPAIALPGRIGGLSGLGLALGNAVGLLMLLLMLYGLALPGHLQTDFIPRRPWFGVDQAAHEPERLTGPISALCLVAFSLPLFLFVPDRIAANIGWLRAGRDGVKSVIRTARALKHYRNVATYIVARLLFNDGMSTLLTVSGIYAAGMFGWGALNMVIYGIVLSVFAVAGGLCGGWIDDTLGSKGALFFSVGGTLVFSCLCVSMGPDRILWFIRVDPHAAPLLAVPIFRTWPEAVYMAFVSLAALCVTASYANARAMMARISPEERMTEFFGLYSLSGQSTAFLATLSASWLTAVTHSLRGGMIAVVIFLALGLAGLVFVREEKIGVL